MSVGTVTIIGAGPGDPDLISVKGLKKLKTAEVVLYDALISEAFFDLFNQNSERIFVGKRSGFHSYEQEEINQLMIDLARKGKSVVRLKGGDPFIYGRGGEEAIALKEAKIEFEIIPGINAINSVSVLSGIPITHRGVSNKFLVIEGQSEISKEEWHFYSSFQGTIVVFMARRTANRIAKKLIQHGSEVQKKIAIIENASLENQKVQKSTLGKVARRQVRTVTNGPALLIIGDVVSLDCINDSKFFAKNYGVAS
jgi:uroporphyrin-III C-methyltransferase